VYRTWEKVTPLLSFYTFPATRGWGGEGKKREKNVVLDGQIPQASTAGGGKKPTRQSTSPMFLEKEKKEGGWRRGFFVLSLTKKEGKASLLPASMTAGREKKRRKKNANKFRREISKKKSAMPTSRA